MADDGNPKVGDIITVKHQRTPDFIISPVTGFIVHGPDKSNVFILQAYVDMPEADTENYRVEEGGQLVGAGVKYEPVRYDVASLFMTREGLQGLYQLLGNWFGAGSKTE